MQALDIVACVVDNSFVMVPKRIFTSEGVYHIYNKSIAGFRIFSDEAEFERFKKALQHYNSLARQASLFVSLRRGIGYFPGLFSFDKHAVVKMISYIIMPTHYHLLLKVQKGQKLSKYIGDVENSFSRYFNLKHKRKGPLWQSRFRSVQVTTDEQLLYLTRYIHLNATTAYLVENPEDWPHSSYREYLENPELLRSQLTEVTISTPDRYKRFVDKQKDYQRTLAKIKKLTLE